jgi:zinc transport system substrate-binding protein
MRPAHPPLFRTLGAALCLWLLCLSAAEAESSGGKLKIVATNYPLAYFAERLGGARVSVDFPVPAEEDPAYWKPDPKAVGALQKADLILLNGADYEHWMARVALPRLKLADTSAGFKDHYIRIENALTHSHGPGGMHSHAGTAYTTWLDFDQAGQQAQAVAEALAKKRPEWRSAVQEELANLKRDLADLDAALKSLLASKPKLALLASHPVYQYLARRYSLNLDSVHWEPNEMPPAEEWAGLEKSLAARPAKWMIWEGQPSAETAAKLKGLGVASLVFDPCANRPAEGDFLTVMQRNVEALKAAFH